LPDEVGFPFDQRQKALVFAFWADVAAQLSNLSSFEKSNPTNHQLHYRMPNF
jgi:hypothetical protein